MVLLCHKGKIKAISRRCWISTEKYHNFYEILRQNVITDIRWNCNIIDKDKTCKTDGIKNILQQEKIEVV